MSLNYSINGVSFPSLGLSVTDSDGVLGGLSLKEPPSVNWPDMHGVAVDLFRNRYDVRKIALECTLVGNNADDFTAKYNNLITQLIRPGYQRLQFSPVAAKPLAYEVYLPSGISVKKKWRQQSKMYGSFTLNLTEPLPVKWMLSAQGGQTVSLTLTCPTPIRLAWGDGTADTLQGYNQTVSHLYGGSSSITYYLIVAGVLEDMNVGATSNNLTEVWNRLY